ncbi:unnamed protein product [Linum trigynum]|uniref:Uncharacterized protein n=1 Tax=Linum trigynum TaxID=586398 RepID=A0AAV2F4U6_9ROSI
MEEKPSLGVLAALDAAKTQWYHFTAVVIASMGFFTDAYDLFCISLVTKLLGRIYYCYKRAATDREIAGIDKARIRKRESKNTDDRPLIAHVFTPILEPFEMLILVF